jgi:hypothetical protein
MPDVFRNAVSRFSGAFAGDGARLHFQGVGDAGFLVQNLSFQYSQNVTRLYEVGRRDIYYVSGRTAGQLTLSRVVGPRTLLSQFYETYGDVCNALTNTMTFSMRNRCDDVSAKYVAKFCVIVSISVNVAAGDMVIGEQSSSMFSSLEYDGP